MKDMTKGSITGAIISFSLPMLISSIFQQLYSLVDTFIVSRYLGPDALAGVGATNLVSFLMLCISLGMGTGGGLIIAQCYGSRNYGKLRSTIISMSYIMLLIALVMSFAGFIYADKFLIFLKFPENVLSYSVTYIRIIFALSIGTVLYNLTSSILRSVGDSKTPLYALIAASFINIGLDLFFILKLNMSVAGAAYATVISQLISGIVCLVIIIRKRADLGFTETGNIFPDAHTTILIIRTSLPSTFQSCLIALGGISVQRLINSFGSDVMAGYIAASKVDSLAIQVILSVGNALCVFTGQNMGTGNLERIETALKKSRFIMFSSAVIIAICAYIFRFSIVGIFLDADADPTALNTGAQYLSIVGIAYLICAIMQSYQNVIKGAGDVNTCMVAGFTELGGKIIFAYAMSPFMGPLGIWISTPFSWACGCIIPVVRYYSGKWKSKSLT